MSFQTLDLDALRKVGDGTSEEDVSWNPWYLEGSREVVVERVELDEEDRSTVSEGAPEKDPVWVDKEDIHKEGDYWQIQKLMKFVKVGDQTTTAIALACLADFDFGNRANQVAVIDTGGLELLVNILETHDLRCQMGSLTILSNISNNLHVQRLLQHLGVTPTLLKLLTTPNPQVQKYAALTLNNMCVQRIGRTVVRTKEGIPILLELIDNAEVLKLRPSELTPETEERFTTVKCCLLALSKLARSLAIRHVLFLSGIVRLVPILVKTADREAYLAALNIISYCASLEGVRKALEMHKHLRYMKKPLNSGDVQKELMVCRILFKCGEDDGARAQIGKLGLYHGLISLVKKDEAAQDEKLLKYCLGALWRGARHPDNLPSLDEAHLVPLFVTFLDHKNVKVKTHVAGCLAELTKSLTLNRLTLLKTGGLPALVSLANLEWDTSLLECVAETLGNCAQSLETASELDRLGALRIVWSLVTGKTHRLQANAALAIVPMLNNTPRVGEKVRSIIGGKEVLVSRLESPCVEVQAAACRALAQVMRDEANLTILSELSIVAKLTRLTPTTDDTLRESLAMAIASCSLSHENGTLFGKLGAISPMVGYLASPNLDVVVAAAFALWKLSIEPINCIALHRSGVVPFLVRCMGSEESRLQEAAGGCLSNIRQLGFEADQRHHLMGRVVSHVKREKHVKPASSSLLLASTLSQISRQPT